MLATHRTYKLLTYIQKKQKKKKKKNTHQYAHNIKTAVTGPMLKTRKKTATADEPRDACTAFCVSFLYAFLRYRLQ